MAAKKGNDYAKGNKGGSRSTLYKKEYARIAKSLALLGATDSEIADALGVCERTINNWKKSHKEFFAALKEGKIIADANVADSLYNRALGYSHPELKVFNNMGEIVTFECEKHYPPDPTSAIFWLKNRQPALWRDKQVEETKSDDLAESISKLIDRLPS